MAAKTPRIIIADALDDLTPDKLDRFRLQLRERKGDGPRLKRAQVDGKKSLDLADLLVETFSGKSVRVTLELLRAVGCMEVADDLEKDAKDLLQPAKENSPAPVTPAAPAAPAAPANQEHFVDRHRLDLTSRVTNINPVLDQLLHHNVLRPEQYDTVRKIETTQEQMRFLYSGPLKSGGECCKDRLLSALEEEEPYLIQDLRKSEG